MHEVDPPEHTVNTLRGFLLHMGTITLGLLIAIALEQTVEALHNLHTLHQLHEDLREESRKNKKRSDALLAFNRANLVRLNGGLKAAQEGSTYKYEMPPVTIDLDSANDAVWKAAVASGTVRLLPRTETQVYGELDGIINDLYQLKLRMATLKPAEEAPKVDFAAKVVDFSGMTPEGRHQYVLYLREQILLVRVYGEHYHWLDAAYTALLNGNVKDIDDITAAEQAPNIPPLQIERATGAHK